MNLEKKYSDKMDFYELPQKNVSEVQEYLLDRINVQIVDDEKKFTVDNIANLMETLGWNNGFIDEYVGDIEAYNDVNGIYYENFSNNE